MKRLSTLFCLILIVLSSIISCRMDESLVWSSFLDKTDTRTEEEVFEQAAKNLVSVAKAVDPFFLGSGSASEMSKHLAEIKEIEGVVDAYSTSSCVFVTIKDWGTIGYPFYEDDDDVLLKKAGVEFIKQISNQVPVIANSTKAKSEERDYSVYILNGTHIELPYTTEIVDVTKGLYEKCGFKVKYEDNPIPSFYRDEIFDYDLIFIIGHGVYDDEADLHWIQTLETFDVGLMLDPENDHFEWIKTVNGDYVEYVKNNEEIRAYRVNDKRNDKEGIVFNSYVSEKYIQNAEKRFAKDGKAVIYLVSCQTLKGTSTQHVASNNESRDINDSMAKAFFGRGAGMYIGYDESTSALAPLGGMRFFANLLSGESFENALIMPDSDDILDLWHTSMDPLERFIIDPNSTYYKEHREKYYDNGQLESKWDVARHVLTDNGFRMDSYIISPQMNNAESGADLGYSLDAFAYYSPDRGMFSEEGDEDSPVFNFTFVEDGRLDYGFSVGTGTDPSEGSHYSAISSRNDAAHRVNFQFDLPNSSLVPYTDYHVWPYIACGNSYNYGDEFTFTTGSLTVPVSSVVLDKTYLTLNVGENATLTAKVLPNNATNKDVAWSSDKESVATVSSNGEVTAVIPGTAVIAATTVDGGFTATCTVEVKPIPIDLTVTTLDATDIAIKKATVSGEYLYDGAGLNIHEQGFVISSTVQNPALSMSGCRSIAAEKTGTSFSATITGLEPLTQYYVAAYMVVVLPYGERQTFYGNVVSFVTDPIKNVIPDEIVDQIDEYMPIHDGINPPVIEGQFVISPMMLVYSTHGYQPGDLFADKYVMFYNQDVINNTLDFRAAEEFDDGSSSGTGTGAFISGEGDDFSVFFNVEEETVYSGYTINTKKAVIFSGTKTNNGIKDLYYAFVMLEKSGDPKSYLVPVGTYRVFKDKDGLSAFTNFFSTKASNRTRVLQNSPKKLPCISTSANEP